LSRGTNNCRRKEEAEDYRGPHNPDGSHVEPGIAVVTTERIRIVEVVNNDSIGCKWTKHVV